MLSIAEARRVALAAQLFVPALATPKSNADYYANVAAALATARKAALADPEGNALSVTLEKLGRVAGAAR